MKRSFRLLLLTAALGLLSGCATMLNRASQGINVISADPEHAVAIEVSTSTGAYATKTPAVVFAESSWAGVEIRVVDRCYAPLTYAVPSSIDTTYWGNALWSHALLFSQPLGLIYFAVDPIAGSLWNYESMVVLPVTRLKDCRGESR